MLKDIALEYSLNDYNCAESLMLAANDYYNLGVKPEDVRMMAGFGAGIQCGDVCGGLVGAIAAISVKYVEQRAHEDRPGLRNKVTKMIRNFEAETGSRLCNDIKPHYYTPETKCQKTIMMAADILEKTINEIENEIA